MLRRCLEASASLVFKVKKLPNGIKDFKTVKNGDPKPKKKTIATEKRVAATIMRIPLKAAAHCQRLAGATAPGNVALDLYYDPD
jgi:hypothetical protein